MKALQFKELTISGIEPCSSTLAQDRQAEYTNECKPQLDHRSHADNLLNVQLRNLGLIWVQQLLQKGEVEHGIINRRLPESGWASILHQPAGKVYYRTSYIYDNILPDSSGFIVVSTNIGELIFCNA